MNLSLIEKNKSYIIKTIETNDPSILSQLQNLGVLEGTQVQLIRKAPWFKDPIIFKISESQIILSKNEAALVQVKEEK